MDEFNAEEMFAYCSGKGTEESRGFWDQINICSEDYFDVNEVFWVADKFAVDIPRKARRNFSIKNPYPEVFWDPLAERKRWAKFGKP
ncbi:hypothetical protein RCC89_18485 [Cytophagaceae bacterium ABcell3]|nr:hypothetical protein RCC89_18485 [Cytophagaceae bacterium ABcell3]